MIIEFIRIAYKLITSFIIGVFILIFGTVDAELESNMKIALRVFNFCLALSIIAMWI